jgi:hypothetical protein
MSHRFALRPFPFFKFLREVLLLHLEQRAEAHLGQRAHAEGRSLASGGPRHSGLMRPWHWQRGWHGGGAVACIGACGLAGRSLWEVWPCAATAERPAAARLWRGRQQAWLAMVAAPAPGAYGLGEGSKEGESERRERREVGRPLWRTQRCGSGGGTRVGHGGERTHAWTMRGHFHEHLAGNGVATAGCRFGPTLVWTGPWALNEVFCTPDALQLCLRGHDHWSSRSAGN